MDKNLVILCAGDESLHLKNQWVNNNKQFDLCVVYYGDNEEKKELYREKSNYYVEVKGPKWSNIYKVLNGNSFWKNYEYIWFPDDDLEVDVENVNKMFEIVRRRDIDLSQPCLVNENVSHPRLVHDNTTNNEVKTIDFVEIQMPCIKRSVVEKLVLPMLIENQDNISGWGYDHYWSKKIDNKYIINSVVVRHTKPVVINSGFYQKYNINPFDEMRTFLQKYGL